jgi:hypothetical protein
LIKHQNIPRVYNKFEDVPESERFSENLPVFATAEYTRFLEETEKSTTIWFHWVADMGTQFIIPLTVKKKYYFKVGTFLTSTICTAEKIDLENEKIFLNSVIKTIKAQKICNWIQQSPNWAIFNAYPDGAVFTNFGSYRINLCSKTKDELLNSIHVKDRADIRKALKEGIVIKRGLDYLGIALHLIKHTAEKAGMRVPSVNDLRSIKDNIEVFLSYYNDVPQTSAIFYTNKFAWYNMYAGTSDKPFRGSNTLLYWAAIRSAKEDGVSIFDFVGARLNPQTGSKQEKIQRFKQHFGVEIATGFMWKMPISKSKFYIYQLLIKILGIIRRQEIKGDIIDQELKRSSK